MSIPTEEKRKIVVKHFDMVYRLAFSQTRDKNHADDVVQEVFLRFIKQEKAFESDEHIKAWLIRVTVNCCHNVFTDLWHKRTAPLSEREDVPVFDTVEESDVYSAVKNLPEKYRVVIHLFYYEDMSIEDISKTLGMKSSTVKSHLHRGRILLREKLEGEYDFV